MLQLTYTHCRDYHQLDVFMIIILLLSPTAALARPPPPPPLVRTSQTAASKLLQLAPHCSLASLRWSARRLLHHHHQPSLLPARIIQFIFQPPKMDRPFGSTRIGSARSESCNARANRRPLQTSRLDWKSVPSPGCYHINNERAIVVLLLPVPLLVTARRNQQLETKQLQNGHFCCAMLLATCCCWSAGNKWTPVRALAAVECGRECVTVSRLCSSFVLGQSIGLSCPSFFVISRDIHI